MSRRNAADVIEDVEFLNDNRTGAHEVARRLDFPSSEALEKWLERNGRSDLWLSLKARDPEGSHSKNARRLQSMTTTQPDPLAALLADAEKSPKARTRNKAQRIADLVAELRDTLAAEREEIEIKERARKDVERLERELAKAKARLRGGSTQVDVGSGVSAADLRAWARRNGIECPPKGRVPATVREAYEADEEVAS